MLGLSWIEYTQLNWTEFVHRSSMIYNYFMLINHE